MGRESRVKKFRTAKKSGEIVVATAKELKEIVVSGGETEEKGA